MSPLFFAISLGLLPSFAWLIFYLREDNAKPEPRLMIAYAFMLGALGTFIAFYIQLPLDGFLSDLGFARNGNISLLALSFIEEVIKFAIVFFFIRQSRYFDEPIDAMIYMVTVALGFAAIENIGAALNQWQEYATTRSVFNIVTLRFIGATLLHSLSSAVVGYYWARGLRSGSSLSVFLIIGLLWATVLHAFFNYLIINMSVIILPTMFLGIIGLFVLHDFEKLKPKINS